MVKFTLYLSRSLQFKWSYIKWQIFWKAQSDRFVFFKVSGLFCFFKETEKCTSLLLWLALRTVLRTIGFHFINSKHPSCHLISLHWENLDPSGEVLKCPGEKNKNTQQKQNNCAANPSWIHVNFGKEKKNAKTKQTEYNFYSVFLYCHWSYWTVWGGDF